MFSEEELLGALKGRIFYNPLVTGYEIKDRFIAGNVIEKAERIEAWIDGNPESERLPDHENHGRVFSEGLLPEL